MKSDKKNIFVASILVIITLCIYLHTLAPTVLFGDGGEFQFVLWLPGITHPTGYPLYTLLGWMFSHAFPFGEIAWRINLLSAIIGAVTIGLVYLNMYRLTCYLYPDVHDHVHHLVGSSVAFIFAFGRTFWSQAIIAEVYTLHIFFVALILWLCLHWADTKPPNSQLLHYFLAFILGLSLTHHSTIILMFPAVGLYIFWRDKACFVRPRFDAPSWKAFWMSKACFVKLLIILPSMLYLYLPLIAPHTPYTTFELSSNQTLVLYSNTLNGFIDHVLARAFRSDIQPSVFGFERLVLAMTLMRQQVGGLGILLGGVGLISLKKNYRLLILTGVTFASFFIFCLIYTIGDIEVLFIPCWFILSLWIGLGWMKIITMTTHNFVKRKTARLTPIAPFDQAMKRLEKRIKYIMLLSLAMLFLIFPITLALTRHDIVNQRHNTFARDAWLDILAQDIPQNAVLITNDRNEIMPLWYYQFVENIRPDLMGMFPLITPEPELATIGGVLDTAFDSNRPVYLIKAMDGLEVKADLYPMPTIQHTQLVEAKRPKQNPDTVVNIDYDNTLTLIGYDQNQAGDTLTIVLYWKVGKVPPTIDYTTYIHAVDEHGQGISQSDHQPGGVFYPTHLWQTDEVLRDTHTLTLPNDLPLGEYSLMAGVYIQSETGEIITLGQKEKF